ncbi:MAG: hypothetical protein ACREN2_10120 [Candidatus Dormibacteria bacterium]
MRTDDSGHRVAPRGIGASQQRSDALRPYVGKWVAQRRLDVLVAASTPQAILAWLERHNQHADVMFRVPLNAQEATGIAPS